MTKRRQSLDLKVFQYRGRFHFRWGKMFFLTTGIWRRIIFNLYGKIVGKKVQLDFGCLGCSMFILVIYYKRDLVVKMGRILSAGKPSVYCVHMYEI